MYFNMHNMQEVLQLFRKTLIFMAVVLLGLSANTAIGYAQSRGGGRASRTGRAGQRGGQRGIQRGAQRSNQPNQQQGYQQGRVGVNRLKGGILLKNIPLGEALKVICRQANLAYTVTEHYIFISTPEKISHTPLADLETRGTQLKTAGSESLPKILVINPGGPGGMGYGGMGYGGIGGQGVGGGGMGGAMGQGYGGVGYGGMGGQGVGGMGYGGMGAGGAGFTNITQLFMPVDHALVGELEPVIGLGGVTQSGGQTSGQIGRQTGPQTGGRTGRQTRGRR